jgi:hypothetical protein
VAVAGVLRRRLEDGARWMDVDGRSMGAAIPAGAKVLVNGSPRPRRGEIWAFCLPDGTVVVHRYRRMIGGRHCFQGDATRWADEPVDGALLIGRVTMVDAGGRVRRFGAGQLALGRMRLDWGTLRRRATPKLRNRLTGSTLRSRSFDGRTTLFRRRNMDYEKPAVESREPVQGELWDKGPGNGGHGGMS